MPAQAALISACTGVSLPPSVVTNIIRDPIVDIVDPLQTRVNQVLGVVGIIPIVGQVFPTLSIDVAGILDQAGTGLPITLQALDVNGQIVGPGDQCATTADSFQLDVPAGISIGGNRILGLGAETLTSSAGELGSIALGNSSSTAGAAVNAVAIGTGATVTASNSVALGAGSSAGRGAAAGYAAPGLAAVQTSAGEVSVGGAGGQRQITNVAAGSAPTDAANVAQLTGAVAASAAAQPVQYANALTPTTPNGGIPTNNVTLSGAVAGPVTLGNVAPGALASGSTDAVNGGQLFATNGAVTTNTTNIAGNTTSITNLTNGTAGIVQQAGGSPGAGTITVGGATGGALIDLTGTGGTRTLTGVTPGTLGPASTEAVNGSQLFATNQGVAANTSSIVTTNNNVTNLTTGLNNGTVGLVQQTGGAPGAGQITVGATTGGTGVSVAGTDGTRVVSGVSAGTAATDAANVGQLTALGATTANAVLYDSIGGVRGNAISLAGGAAGPVRVTNVAPAVLAAGSTDAVNGEQLAATNAQTSSNTSNIAANTAGIGANTTAITGLTNGTAGLLLQAGGAPGPGQISIGAFTGGTSLSVAGTDGARVVSGVSAGVAATDAANVGQLSALGATTANAVLYDSVGGVRTNSLTLTGGAAGPVTVSNVAPGAIAAGSTDAVNGDQLFATNTQVTTNTSDIATTNVNLGNLAVGLNNGTLGLVQQVGGAPGAGLITVGATTGGTGISVAGTDGTRVVSGVSAGVAGTDAVNVSQLNALGATTANAVLYDSVGGVRTNAITLAGGAAGPVTVTNVAPGAVAAGSTDAVNGDQLFATNTQVTTNTSDIATNTTAITNLTNGTAGLVQQTGGSPGAGQLTIGAATGGTSVSIAGTDGSRVLTGLGAGLGATDAATVGQLGLVVGGAFNAVQYDIDAQGGRLNTVSLAGGLPGPVGVTNIAAGALTATSTDAVNGGQLAATDARVAANTAAIVTNSTTINNIVAGNAGAFRSNNAAGAAAASATGADAVAGGFGASASGSQSVALGNGAVSTGSRSVALGTQSTDGGVANVVSVGSVGAERRIVNVGPAVNGTDAVNLSQLQAATSSFTAGLSGVQTQIDGLGFDLRNAKRRANAGTAGALAVAALPQAFNEGRGMVGGAVGLWQDQVAFAIGVSKIVGDDTVVKAGASVSGRGSGGFNAGVGFQF